MHVSLAMLESGVTSPCGRRGRLHWPVSHWLQLRVESSLAWQHITSTGIAYFYMLYNM